MIIQENTIPLFEQNKQYVLDYLKERGVKNRTLRNIYLNQAFGLLKDVTFFVNDEPYEVSHFLSKSEVVGYDIRKVNSLLNTDSKEILVFAIVLGDDVLCYDTKSKMVYLWLIQTGNGEKIVVSNSLTQFLKKLEKIV